MDALVNMGETLKDKAEKKEHNEQVRHNELMNELEKINENLEGIVRGLEYVGNKIYRHRN